jgi:hypothetical protein
MMFFTFPHILYKRDGSAMCSTFDAIKAILV